APAHEHDRPRHQQQRYQEDRDSAAVVGEARASTGHENGDGPGTARGTTNRTRRPDATVFDLRGQFSSRRRPPEAGRYTRGGSTSTRSRPGGRGTAARASASVA